MKQPKAQIHKAATAPQEEPNQYMKPKIKKESSLMYSTT